MTQKSLLESAPKESRTPLSTITNTQTADKTRRSSSRQRNVVVYAEEHVTDESDHVTESSQSSQDQIEKDLMLLPEVRKRHRDEEQSGESEEEFESESDDSSEHVTRTRVSDVEKAASLRRFQDSQQAKFAEIDDFELNFEEVAEDSFDKSMSEQGNDSVELELDDVLGREREDRSVSVSDQE